MTLIAVCSSIISPATNIKRFNYNCTATAELPAKHLIFASLCFLQLPYRDIVNDCQLTLTDIMIMMFTKRESMLNEIGQTMQPLKYLYNGKNTTNKCIYFVKVIQSFEKIL